MTDDSTQPVPAHGGLTEILIQGGFKTVDGNKKLLAKHGIKAEVIAPPGVNLNG